MKNNQQENITNWRKHWFIKNVLAEIPVIGGFFEHETCASGMHAAAKCASMLLGGSMGMINSSVTSTEHHTTEHIAQMTAEMAIGMMAGKVAFNGLFSGATMLYQYANSRPSESQDTDLELQTLTNEGHLATSAANTERTNESLRAVL